MFLPGVGADPDFWRPLGDRLPADWDKTYLGWPGLGDQPADPAINSYDDLIDRVLAAIGDGPADLVAQSMGGALAMKVALDHPAKVRRLVLAVTSGGVDVEGLGGVDWRSSYRESYPQAPDWALSRRFDLTERISALGHPVLLLFGDADPIAPAPVGRHLLELLLQAELHITLGGNHDLVRTHAAELAVLVEQHLG